MRTLLPEARPGTGRSPGFRTERLKLKAGAARGRASVTSAGAGETHLLPCPSVPPVRAGPNCAQNLGGRAP